MKTNITSSNQYNFKYGPYDYFKGNDDIIKMPPLFINSIIFLEKYGLEEEGLMHTHGNERNIRRLRQALYNGPIEMTQMSDVHTVATILREFFQEAPVSLLPEHKYAAFISLAEARQLTLERIREQLMDIPLSHQRVLHRLLIFFRAVLKQFHKNKVRLETIAVKYGPVIMRPPSNMPQTSSADSEAHSEVMFKLICKLLDNYVNLFEGIGLNYPGPEVITWSRIEQFGIKRKTPPKYAIPSDMLNPSKREAQEDVDRVRRNLTEIANKMGENFERAKEKRKRVLQEAKEKAVREWLLTKRNYEMEKANYDHLHQIWQLAADQVAQTTKSIEDARGDYDSLKKYYGVTDEPSPFPSPNISLPSLQSANPSPPPSPRGGQVEHPTTPTYTRERGLTDPTGRRALFPMSPPPRPIAVSFSSSSQRPPMPRRSSDPPKFQTSPLQHSSSSPLTQHASSPLQHSSLQLQPLPEHLSQQQPQTQQSQQSQQSQQPQQTQQTQQHAAEFELHPQQQRKLQVHQQLMQTLHVYVPSPVLPKPAQDSPQLNRKFTPPSGFSTDPTPSQQIQSQLQKKGERKSLPPLPSSPVVPSPPVAHRPQLSVQQSEAQAQADEKAELQKINELERKYSLTRSYSDDQTRREPLSSLALHVSSSLPDFTALINAQSHRPATPPQPSPMLALTEASKAVLKPDEVAHLDEAHALVEYLEAELELQKFEMLTAEKDRRQAEMPYDLAQVEHYRTTQGIRRLDITDEEAENWTIK